MSQTGLPARQGLYDPTNERDACGVGFVAHIKGAKSHGIIRQGLQILHRLTHRGAVGADPRAGDGAGILIQIPDAFLRAVAGVDLPPPGDYAVGMVFLPRPTEARSAIVAVIEEVVAAAGQRVLGWRDVLVDNSGLGESVKPSEPFIRQVFVARGPDCADQDAFERKLFVVRKIIENRVRSPELACRDFFYIPCTSASPPTRSRPGTWRTRSG
jgi:glutamate synthase (NADPH/NADH) large chain